MSLRLVPCRLAAALLFPGWGRPALAALALVGSASLAHAADALRIEHLLLSADASLNLRSGVNSADFASGGQSLDQLDGLIGAPAITASALDVPQGFTSPTGLSFAFSQQANTAYYRDRISVVNDYPGDTPHYTQGLPTQVSVRTSTAYDLSVSALQPDAPLGLTLQVNGARLRASDYYAASTLRTRLDVSLQVALDNGPLLTVWAHEVVLDLLDGQWVFQARNLIDAQGAGQPQWNFDSQNLFFVTQAQADTGLFTAPLDFGLLQPGHSFQLRYESVMMADAAMPYPGAQSFIDMDFVDPLTLGGDYSHPPITLTGLTLPSAVPEPPAAALALLGLVALRLRRRRAR